MGKIRKKEPERKRAIWTRDGPVHECPDCGYKYAVKFLHPVLSVIQFYPPSDGNYQAIQWDIELAEEYENPKLLILPVNELQKDQRITRKTLRDTVESLFEGFSSSYMARNGFFVEASVTGLGG